MPLIVRSVPISEVPKFGEKIMHLGIVEIWHKEVIIIILCGTWHMVHVQREMDLARYIGVDQ